MIVVRDVEQGTIEWLQLRCGIPTASRFSEILTPSTRKISKASESYAVELITERILGHPLDFGGSQWMERGTGLEAEARRWYSFSQDVEVEQVGFCFTDDKSAGCSPDGLVAGAEIGIEIKCPSAKVHMGHLLGRTNPADATQVQGALLVTDYKLWDVVSYCPGLPPVLIRTPRDEEYLADLTDALGKFRVGMDVLARKLEGMGAAGRVEGFGAEDNDSLMAELYGSLGA